jgi:hypothetical protein
VSDSKHTDFGVYLQSLLTPSFPNNFDVPNPKHNFPIKNYSQAAFTPNPDVRPQSTPILILIQELSIPPNSKESFQTTTNHPIPINLTVHYPRTTKPETVTCGALLVTTKNGYILPVESCIVLSVSCQELNKHLFLSSKLIGFAVEGLSKPSRASWSQTGGPAKANCQEPFMQC